MPENIRPSRIRVLVFSSLGHFINDGMGFFIPVIAAILASQHGVSPLLVTAVLTLYYLTSAGCGILVGLAADSLGDRGTIMAVGILVLALGLFAFAAALAAPAGLARDGVSLLAAVLAGAGSSFYHPVGGSLLQLTFSDRARGRALGVNGSFGSLGRALYPSIFFVVAALSISTGSTVLLFACVGVVASLAIAAGLRPGAVGAGSGNNVQRREVLVASGLSPDGNEKASAPPGPDGRQGPASSPPLLSLLDRSVITLMAIAFLRSMAFIGIVSWMPIYLATQKHAGLSSQLGITVTVLYAGGILGQPLFGLLADSLDKRVVLSANSLGAAGSILLYLSTAGPLAMLFLLLFGFFTFAAFPLLLSLVSDYVPREASATGNALVWGIGSTGGQALGPVAVSLLTLGAYHRLGFAFAVLAVVAAATVVGAPLLRKTARHTAVARFG